MEKMVRKGKRWMENAWKYRKIMGRMEGAEGGKEVRDAM